MKQKYFDCHFHIIDKNFPLVPNQGLMPDAFTSDHYLARVKDIELCGGAVVSGSFQALDQTYLFHALKVLGPSFVGVTVSEVDRRARASTSKRRRARS